MQYRKIKLFVGIFVTLFFGIIVVSGWFLLKEKGFFDKKYNYYFQTSSASSFSVGMPLKLSGFDIGSIEAMELQDDATVKVRFSVKGENKKWISQGTVLVMKKPLIGSAHIEVHSRLGAQPLKAGALLEMQKSDDINDLIERLEPVVKKMMNIIDNIDRITIYLTKDDSDIIKILRNVEHFSKKLADEDSMLTTITGDKEATQSVVQSLHDTQKITQNIQKITEDLSEVSGSLHKEIIKPSAEVVEELQAILKDVNKKLKALNGTVEAVGDSKADIEEMKKSLHVTIEKSNEVLRKVNTLLGAEQKEEVQLP